MESNPYEAPKVADDRPISRNTTQSLRTLLIWLIVGAFVVWLASTVGFYCIVTRL